MLTSSDWLTEISCYRIIFQKINTTRIPDKFLPKIPWLAVILIEECFHHQPSWTMIMKVTQLFSCLMKYFLLQLLIVKAKAWTLTNWNFCSRVGKTFRSHRHHKVLAWGTYWYLRVSTKRLSWMTIWYQTSCQLSQTCRGQSGESAETCIAMDWDTSVGNMNSFSIQTRTRQPGKTSQWLGSC